MDAQQVLAGLQQGLVLVEALSPAVALAGPQGAAAAAVIGALGKYGETVLEAAQSADVALAAEDLATIQASVAAIQARNAALVKQIQAS